MSGARATVSRYDHDSEFIKPQYVVEMLYKVTGGDAFITSDVGQHQMWAAQFYLFDNPAALDQFRRPGHHGFRSAGSHGCAACLPR